MATFDASGLEVCHEARPGSDVECTVGGVCYGGICRRRACSDLTSSSTIQAVTSPAWDWNSPSTDNQGGGFFSFTNVSGETFHNLELYVPDLPTSDMTCSGSAFAFCAIEPGEAGYAGVIDFWGGPGLANNDSFTIDMVFSAGHRTPSSRCWRTHLSPHL